MSSGRSPSPQTRSHSKHPLRKRILLLTPVAGLDPHKTRPHQQQSLTQLCPCSTEIRVRCTPPKRARRRYSSSTRGDEWCTHGTVPRIAVFANCTKGDCVGSCAHAIASDRPELACRAESSRRRAGWRLSFCVNRSPGPGGGFHWLGTGVVWSFAFGSLRISEIVFCLVPIYARSCERAREVYCLRDAPFGAVGIACVGNTCS